MKKIFFALTAFLFLSQAVYSQVVTDVPSNPKRNLIKLTPQHFIMKAFQVDYEVALGDKNSIQFSPSVTIRENDEYKKVTGGGLEIIKKFYIGRQEQVMEGFYAGITASYHRYKIQNNKNCYYDFVSNREICNEVSDEKVNRFALNVIFGHQFILNEVVAIDLYVGGGMRVADSDYTFNQSNVYYYNSDIFDYNYTGVSPKLGVSVGLAF